MAFVIDFNDWLPGSKLVVLDAKEAIDRIDTLQSIGLETPRVSTIDGDPITLFELQLLAAPAPIMMPPSL